MRVTIKGNFTKKSLLGDIKKNFANAIDELMNAISINMSSLPAEVGEKTAINNIYIRGGMEEFARIQNEIVENIMILATYEGISFERQEVFALHSWMDDYLTSKLELYKVFEIGEACTNWALNAGDILNSDLSNALAIHLHAMEKEQGATSLEQECSPNGANIC